MLGSLTQYLPLFGETDSHSYYKYQALDWNFHTPKQGFKNEQV